MQIVIDIPEELYKANYRGLEAEELWDLRIAIKNGTPIPNNATNGDVMKIIFPKIGVYDEWYDEPY